MPKSLPVAPVAGFATAKGPAACGRRRVTQQVIAKLAGVHNTTVSLALRNHPTIPSATRERIKALALLHGYRPDPALQALASYRTGLAGSTPARALAFVTDGAGSASWLQHDSHAAFYEGACRRALDVGYQVERFSLGEPGMSARRLGDVLFNRGIEGVLLALDAPGAFDGEGFGWERFSVVSSGSGLGLLACPCVASDPEGAMCLALRRVLEVGYERPALVCHDQPALPLSPGLPSLIVKEGAAAMSAEALLSAWLRAHSPDVLVCSGDETLAWLRSAGLSVPGALAVAAVMSSEGDCDVAGFHGLDSCAGETAAELLAWKLRENQRGLPVKPCTTLVQGEWRSGESLPRKGGRVPVPSTVPAA